jgi:hypothetical protein
MTRAVCSSAPLSRAAPLRPSRGRLYIKMVFLPGFPTIFHCSSTHCEHIGSWHPGKKAILLSGWSFRVFRRQAPRSSSCPSAPSGITPCHVRSVNFLSWAWSSWHTAAATSLSTTTNNTFIEKSLQEKNWRD